MARFYLTGGLRVEGPDGTFVDADLPGGQARLTLAALVLERRPLARDALAELVWDGDVPSQWSGALSAIVSKIRSLLGRVGLDGSTQLTSVDGAYVLSLPPDAWVDLEDAYRRLDMAEGAQRNGRTDQVLAEATAARATLRRPLLAGSYHEWTLAQRRRQDDALFRCMTLLSGAWIKRGDHQLAASIAASLVELDPLREVGHRLLMEAEWERGDRGAALRAFERCERELADALGAHPAEETRALATAIRG
ncbi:MAG: hypothetical protein H8E59_00325 [Actinobacteria bacterium]|nr:hypothetical protein [Actinomycetota bacterium]